MSQILVVDDEEIERRALEKFIEVNFPMHKITFFHARNGLEALEIIEEKKFLL